MPRRLTDTDAALVKAMLQRGDKQHDIAAYFGVNGGRVAEIASGGKFAEIPATSALELPPRGPYHVRGFLRLVEEVISRHGEEHLRRILERELEREG